MFEPTSTDDARMLRLSFSAYAYLKGHDYQAGRQAIGRAMNVFGLAGNDDWFAVSDDHHQFNFALVFVVKESKANVTEYSVVVRGTNPLSLDSWFREDFAVGVMVPWSADPTHGKISQATATALLLHERLRDGNLSLHEYLNQQVLADKAAGRTSVIQFTGHSLGGLLAPVLALRFSESFPRFDNLEVHVHSFAAPAAGDKQFAAYLEHSFVDRTRQNFVAFRFIRCRDDVAVKVWNKNDMLGILPLYSAYGVPINLFLVTILGLVRWNIRKWDYAQPFSGTTDSRVFRVEATDLFALDDFDAESYLDGSIHDQFHRAKAIAKRQPSFRVFRSTFAWIVQGVVMHIVPYAQHLLNEAEQKYVAGTTLKTILTHDTFFVERRGVPRS